MSAGTVLPSPYGTVLRGHERRRLERVRERLAAGDSASLLLARELGRPLAVDFEGQAGAGLVTSAAMGWGGNLGIHRSVFEAVGGFDEIATLVAAAVTERISTAENMKFHDFIQRLT